MRPKNPIVEQAKEIVLRLLEDGEKDRSCLADAVTADIEQADSTQVNSALSALRNDGQIVNVSRGVWALAKKKRRRDGSVGGGIKSTILEVLREGQFGRSEIIERTLQRMPSANSNTINTSLYALANDHEIMQIERGVWSLPDQKQDDSEIDSVRRGERLDNGHSPQVERALKKEVEFYEPFADWLKGEIGECTHAVKLGGNSLGKKWGTPDVIGVYRVEEGSFYKPREIVDFVSAEIKIDSGDPVGAFGQACAYLHFSHKVYLVLPTSTLDKDKVRMQSLCNIVGLGLVFFNPDEKRDMVNSVKFDIRVRPAHREPDTLALNEVLNSLRSITDVWKEIKG